jgi:hypothetical protein
MGLGRFYLLPFQDGEGGWWYISPWTGNLIKTSEKPFAKKIPVRISSALDSCLNPFDCEWNPFHKRVSVSDKNNIIINKVNERLFLLGNSRFLLSVIYSHFTVPIFKCTQDAFSHIAEIPGHKDMIADRCFQRSLLAAKISQSFQQKGVLFVGSEISSGEMHAWIIEENMQPDLEDRSWINYRPLLAII